MMPSPQKKKARGLRIGDRVFQFTGTLRNDCSRIGTVNAIEGEFAVIDWDGGKEPVRAPIDTRWIRRWYGGQP